MTTLHNVLEMIDTYLYCILDIDENTGIWRNGSTTMTRDDITYELYLLVNENWTLLIRNGINHNILQDMIDIKNLTKGQAQFYRYYFETIQYRQ